MTRNTKYRLLFAFLSIIVANSTHALTYYSKPGTDPSIPSSWNTAPNGSGANAANFSTPGDIFILQAGQIQKLEGDLIIGTGVTLQLDGSIQFQKKASDKLIIRGTVVFTSNRSQVTIVNGAGNSDHEFTLDEGARLITSNPRGIHGFTNASIQNSARITVSLSPDADYEFNGANQILYGLPSTVRNLCFSGTGTKSARESYAITQDLSIEPGATFSAANYNHNLHGNWINNGVFSADNSTVTFSSAGSQYIRGSSSTIFNNLTIAKGGTSVAFLEVNTSVQGTIRLINGYLDIAEYSLYVENTIGGSSGSYIRTSGTGRLKRNVPAGETKDFPVGNAAYNPAGITNDQTSGTDAFNIRVSDDPISNSNDQTKTVNRRWYITKDAAGNTSITAHLTYNTGEQQAGFDSGVNPYIGAFIGTLWAYVPASVNGYTLSASGPIPQLVDDAFLAIGSGDAFTASRFVVFVSPDNPLVGLANAIITVNSVNSVGIPTLVATQTNFSLSSITTFNGTAYGTIPVQNYEYQIPNIQFTSVFTDATVTATRADNSGELLNPGTSDLFNVVAGTIWEPVSSGNWNAVSWRSSDDGGFVWTNPASLPANNVFGETDLIYIPSGISLAANVNATFYSMIVEGSIDLTNGATLTLSHLTGDDHYNVHVHGTIKNSGGSFVNSNELHPIKIHGGTYEHARDGGSIPVAEWYSLEAIPSTCKVTGITVTSLLSGLGQNFQNFIWDNAGQTVTQNLHGNLTVGNDLNLANGVITTGDNFVIKSAAGTITRTNGYVNGNFRYYVPGGSNEGIWFPVGDNLSYAPVQIVFNGTTSGSGYMDAFTAVEIPPVASGLSHDNYINRKWSITANGVNFTSFSAGFTFSDNDRVGSPLDASLKLRRSAEGIWNSTNGVATGNTMSAGGLTSPGVFVIGEDGCSISNATWFGSISTDWNTAGNWCSESVPDASTDVFIPGGISRFPVIGPEGATVKGITIESGASLTTSEACTLDVKGDWNNSGSFTPNTGTVSFTGSSNQTVSGINTYYNLVINNPAAVTAAGDITVNGHLSLQSANPSAISGTLDMGTLELIMGSNSITTGTGDVTGIVTRNHIFSGNTPYSFGSMYTTLRFINIGTKPASVSCRITIGADPGWFPVSPEVVTPVLREYSFKQSGGDDNVILQLRYLESELNGSTESDMVLWQKSSGFNPHEHGKTAYDLSDNWLALASLPINHLAGDDLDNYRWGFAKTLSLRNRWIGGISTSWKERDNWSAGHFPGEIRNNAGITEEFFDDNITIQAATTYQPTLDTIARFKSIDIEAGAHLTTGQNAGNEYFTMQITGDPRGTGTWNNLGTFTPGKGKVIFDGDSINTPLTIAGETDFYDLETGSATYLQPSSSSILNINGNLSVNPLSIIDLFATDNTFNYTGTESRTLINPKGPGDETGYYNLIISNSAGEISLPEILNITGDFTNNISGTGSLNTTGSRVNFDDPGNNLVNYIRGATPTSFDIVIFNNTMGIIAETDIIVNGQIELAVDNPPIPGKGVLDMANGSILKMGENAVTFGIGDVTGIISRTHSFNDNFYYSFGAQNSGVTFAPTPGQVKPSSITLKVMLGTAPDWSSDTDWSGNPAMPDPIYRLYELSQTGGSGTRATIRVHYRQDELPIGVDENKLTIWSRVATGGTPAFIGKEEGKSGHNTSENSITIQDANFSFIPSTPGYFQSTLAPSSTVSSTWNGLISNDWDLPSNWDPTGVPTSATTVIVPNAALTPYSPSLPASAECKSVYVEPGGVLNAAAAGGTLSVSGADLAWHMGSGGTFNAKTGTVVFTSPDGPVSIDGTTFFYNLEITAGTTLQPSAGSYTGVSGMLSINGIFSGTTNDNVIEFNGTDQNIPNPSGSKYHDLKITGTGTKTFPANLYIEGSFTNNGATDAFTNTSTVIMGGAEHGHDQIIDGTTATIFNNLTIQNGTTVMRSPQKASGIILVDGRLNSDGFLTLTSTASKTALVDGTGTGQISGDVTMERYLSSGMGYKYISSPFQSATVGELSPEIDLTSESTSIYRYDENRNILGTPASGWVYYKSTINLLYPMVGYAVNCGYDDVPKTLDLTGVVNNGPLSIEVSNNNNPYTTGFNLVGNPYPSPIDWNAPSGWTRTNIDDALYFFKAGTIDQYEGYYSTYINGIPSDGSVSNIIPSMQGFFVHVKDGVYPVNGTFQMDNNVRVINQSQLYLKGGKSDIDDKGDKGIPVIRFTASFSDNIPFPDFAVAYFDPKSTLKFNGQMDALKLMNSDINVPNFYFVTPGDVNLQIHALPPVSTTLCKVPLGIKIKRDGHIIIKIRDIDPDFANLRISISDMVNGTEQDLLAKQEFKIYLSAGEYLNRFFLNISELPNTIPENTEDEEIFSIYHSQNSLHATINQLYGSDATLTIYNLLGQTLLTEMIRAEGYHIINAQLKDGIYIATYLTGKTRISKKISVRN